MAEIFYRTNCHPLANGRQPEHGDERWTIRLPTERGHTLVIELGRKGRDLLFGMLIADAADNHEEEPA